MKAILVIDMPSCCVECPCYDFDLGLCSPKNEITDVDGRHDERAEWCPLKPFDYKVGALGSVINSDGYTLSDASELLKEITDD